MLPGSNFIGGLVFLWRPARKKNCFKKERQYEKQERKKYGKEAFDFTLSQWNAALNCNINGRLIAGNLNCSAMKKRGVSI